MSKSDVFDLLGVCLVAVFAYSVRPSLALLVIAVACFLAGRVAHK